MLVSTMVIQASQLTRPWANSAAKDLLSLCRMSGLEANVDICGANSSEGLAGVAGVDVCTVGAVVVALPFKNVDIGTP